MKNKLSDVRNHLVAMLEMLGDKEVSPEVLERAKVASQVAGVYIQGVKVEIDACRVAADLGVMPAVIDQPRVVRHDDPRVVAFEGKGYRSAG